MRIRAEQVRDRSAVRAVNESAFDTRAEADLVENLHAQAVPVISLVAEEAGSVVGHILFSPVDLPDHPGLKVMGLGPVAVVPEHQRKGIGSALVRAGLDRCRRTGVGAVVLVGHPEYYPRFGFAPGAEFGIRCDYDVPDEAFMALELQPGYLKDASGVVKHHEAFDDV
jgi:putative acetyltransferase